MNKLLVGVFAFIKVFRSRRNINTCRAIHGYLPCQEMVSAFDIKIEHVCVCGGEFKILCVNEFGRQNKQLKIHILFSPSCNLIHFNFITFCPTEVKKHVTTKTKTLRYKSGLKKKRNIQEIKQLFVHLLRRNST